MMTSDQYSKTIQREPTTSTQSIPSVTQHSTADTPCKQTDVVDKPLSSRVPILETTNSFESSNAHLDPKVATTDSPSSCNLDPRETAATDLKSKIQLPSEDFLLYNDNLDEEMSCDLDSSLEGKLLIDESSSDEESGTKDDEILNREALPDSQPDKPTSSIPTAEKRSNQGLNRINGASEAQSYFHSQELRNNAVSAISSTNTEKKKEEVDKCKENDLNKRDSSYSRSLDVASNDSWSTNTKISKTEEFFADKDISKTDFKEKNPKIDSGKTFNESDKTILKETKTNLSDTINQTAETSPKEVLNKHDSKDLISEQICAKEHSTQSIQKPSNKELTTSKTVPRTVSPDSTTYAGEESCRLSFVLIEDYFLCLSCSKLFKKECFFKQHVWRHFHISSMQLLCKSCLSNKDSSQCPAVKEIFTMLHNSCSKDVSSLHLELLLNTAPAKDKDAVVANQTVNDSNDLPKDLHVPPESRHSIPMMSPLKDQSQNVECLIFCILSQLFVCLKCNKRMDTTKLPQHVYDHLHALNLPKHSRCVNEKECNIMDRIIPPMMSSINIDKDDFYILKISWKWTVQRDLRYRVQLVRHYPNNEASGDNHAITPSRQELQLVKSWNFLIPNTTKTNSCMNANNNDIEIVGSKQLTDDNVAVDSVPGYKETPSLVLTKQGYKKITFVIRLGRYICKACRKIYANLNLLNAHIMWHFHSHEKICSLDHYDGLPLKGKECPILSNIESCIRKLDKETKMLNVYWKTDTNGKTYFHMQIVLPKENPVIDLSNQESDDEYQATPNQDGKNISKGDAVIVIDDSSVDANSDQTEKVSLFRKSKENEDEHQKQIKTNRLTEREIPKLEIPKLEIPKSEFTNSEIPKLEIQENQFADEKLVKKCFENLSVANVQNEGGFYVCGFSNCRFSSIESEQFFEHLKTCHCHEERFLCIHCHHCASSVELLMKHFDGHTNQTLFLLYQCAACEYATNMLLQFEKHLRSNHAKSNSFLCRYCKQGFSSMELLIQHLNKNLLKFIKCPSCDARDTYRRRMLRHIAARHPNTPRKIVVSSQIICKTISQNKLLSKEILAQDANAMLQTSKIGFDEQQEGNDASKRATVIKSNESASREAKSANNYSPINHLNHLISNINSIPTLGVHGGSTYSQDDEMDTSSMKNVSSSMLNNSIIDDTVSRIAAAKCNSDAGEIQMNTSQKKQSILVELLSHVDEKTQEGNDILSKLYASVQRRDSFEAKDVDKDEGSQVAKEDRMMKENYKLHSEVKVMLTRTNWPNEMSDIKNVSSDQSLGSGKERNVFQLFGGMERNANVHRSQSPSFEAPVLIAESESILDKNNSTFEDVNRDDGATDSPCTEESSDEKIQAPSQLHEISLGGSLLDVHLQKCYTFSNQPSQSKQLSCIICHHVSKTLYRMHLHLLCDHFKWPLWECQDCGLRVYSHSKITTHCWRIHRNQSPRIKSLQLPIIELDNNNEFVAVNTQEEFVGSLKAPLLTEAMKKKPAAASVPSKLKKNKSTTDITVPPTEDPQPLPKSSRKRSKSTSSDKSDTKKKKSSSNVMLEDTSNVMESASMALSASVVDKTDEQPPEKKSETSTDVDRKEKKCSMCGFTCSLKTEVLFLQHMILEHMKEYKHQISDREIKLVEEAITGNSLEGFSCPFCYYSTDQRVDCKIHIWRTHARLKLLKCTRCKFVTWFEHHLKDHVAKRHGNKEEGEPSKNNDTPGDSAGKSDTNQTLLTSLKALSTLKSIIQKRKNQATSLEPVKPSLCSSCENVTLLELRDQLKKQQLKLLNGNIKSEKTESVAQKPLSNVKSSSSHSQAHKKDESKKKLNPSTDSTELSSKTKKLKTSSVSVPPSTSNKSDSSSKEKSSAKKIVPAKLKGVLPRPPFPLEKKSASKSSKKNTSSSKKESASGSKSTESKRTASSHLYVETKCSKTGKKLYKCPVCLATKKSISDIEYHWKKYQNAIYRCSQCSFKRHQSDQVLQHIKREHQNKGNVRSFQLGDSQTEKSKAEK